MVWPEVNGFALHIAQRPTIFIIGTKLAAIFDFPLVVADFPLSNLSLVVPSYSLPQSLRYR